MRVLGGKIEHWASVWKYIALKMSRAKTKISDYKYKIS